MIYYIWISLVALAFIIYEILFNLKFKKHKIKYIKLKNNNHDDSNNEYGNGGDQSKQPIIIDLLGNEKYESLPELTLDEFNDKVQKGVSFLIKWVGV